MNKLIFFAMIVSSLQAQAGTVPSPFGLVKDGFSCVNYITTYGRRANKGITEEAATYICRTSTSKADAAACAYVLYAAGQEWTLKNGQSIRATADSVVYACSYSDSTRYACVSKGKKDNAHPATISSICNPHKNRAGDELEQLYQYGRTY